jgi:Flp pilus assembly protein CpaB
LKRSNRLIFLIGIILAVVAFVGVFLLASDGGDGGGGPAGGQATPPPVDVVTAKQDIQTGTIIENNMLTTTQLAADVVPFDAITTPSQIVGLPARQVIVAGQPITLSMFGQQGTSSNADVLRALEPGFRAMAVQVDQVTGVGTIIQPGDRVDVVISFEDTDGKFPVVYEGPSERTGTPPQVIRTFELFDDRLNNTSIKVLVQDSKVLGTLLPPPPAETDEDQATPAPTAETGEVALTGQQQILLLQLTPQQVELVRFAQLDGNLSVVLRAVADIGQPPIPTTGITLFELVQQYGVLPGQMTVQAPPLPAVVP